MPATFGFTMAGLYIFTVGIACFIAQYEEREAVHNGGAFRIADFEVQKA
jgi:hypothetical protein